MAKYIDAEKLIAEINKIRHNWLDDSTGLEVGECGAELGAAESILDSIEDIINSFQQEQPEVNFEDIEFLLNKVKYMRGYWVKTNPDCTEIVKDFNKRLNSRKEENK